MTEFNADSILGSSISGDEFDGKKLLTAEGSYPASLITNVEVFEPHEDAKADGCTARLRVTFQCPTNDCELSTYIKMFDRQKPKSAFMRLTKALFPEKEAAIKSTPRDWKGQTVDVYVKHESGNFGEWADFLYTPTKVAAVKK